MNICATCKWWNEDAYTEAAQKYGGEWGCCMLSSDEDVRRECRKVAVFDGEYGYPMTIETRFDFGCVCYERRPGLCCQTCRWWREGDEVDYANGFGRCAKKEEDRQGTCAVATRPDWGCEQWEAKA